MSTITKKTLIFVIAAMFLLTALVPLGAFSNDHLTIPAARPTFPDCTDP